MAKNLLAALKPMNIFCTIFGFYYIRDDRVLSRKYKFHVLDLLEVFRCFFSLFSIFYIADNHYGILNTFFRENMFGNLYKFIIAVEHIEVKV